MYKFTEEQIMIRDMVREFTKNEVAPYDDAKIADLKEKNLI